MKHFYPFIDELNCYKTFDDSSVVYRVGNEVHFGQINRIFTLDHGDVLFQMFSLVSSADFTYETSEAQFFYDHIQVGTINARTAIYFIKAE